MPKYLNEQWNNIYYIKSWTNDGAFDEKNLSYDHNGNIMSLKRNALLAGVATEVDNLSYSYTGNQLSNVTDGTGGSYAAVGFKNVTGSTGVDFGISRSRTTTRLLGK